MTPNEFKPRSVSVSEALEKAQDALNQIFTIRVLGEVSGFGGPHSFSGHCYFDIKDKSAKLSCIIWKSAYQKRSVDLKDGMLVELTGYFNIYKPSGKMSFVAQSFTPAGEGMLRQQVAQLINRLKHEGLVGKYDGSRIPRFCETIAVVTSLSGSVIDDVCRTLKRRNPLVKILTSDCSVQGTEAPKTIITALNRAIQAKPDAILLVRGGGSFEDLMAFNDETLARVVSASPVPIITGIGHEPDVTVCDLVADRRSSTPTSAAESVAPAFDELVKITAMLGTRLAQVQEKTVSRARQTLVEKERVLHLSVSRLFDTYRHSLAHFESRSCLVDPTSFIDYRTLKIVDFEERMHKSVGIFLKSTSEQIERYAKSIKNKHASLVVPFEKEVYYLLEKLEALSPLSVLKRGYAYVQDSNDHVVTQANPALLNKTLKMNFSNGSVLCKVEDVIINPE